MFNYLESIFQAEVGLNILLDDQTENWIDSWSYGWIDDLTNSWINSQTDGENDGQADCQSDSWIPSQTHGQTHRTPTTNQLNLCRAQFSCLVRTLENLGYVWGSILE